MSPELRACMGRIFDQRVMSFSRQRVIALSQGQQRIDREIRSFIGRARPANYPHHERARTIREAEEMSRTRAQYLPGFRVRTERRALDPQYPPLGFQEGQGRMIKYVEMPNVIGYDLGRPTRFMRVELSPDGEFHGHPMDLSRLRTDCPSCVSRIRR